MAYAERPAGSFACSGLSSCGAHAVPGIACAWLRHTWQYLVQRIFTPQSNSFLSNCPLHSLLNCLGYLLKWCHPHSGLAKPNADLVNAGTASCNLDVISCRILNTAVQKAPPSRVIAHPILERGDPPQACSLSPTPTHLKSLSLPNNDISVLQRLMFSLCT